MAPKNDDEKKQVEEACKALGVAKEYLFASKVFDDRVVIVTVGGFKGVYTPGKTTERLPEYMVTGKGMDFDAIQAREKAAAEARAKATK